MEEITGSPIGVHKLKDELFVEIALSGFREDLEKADEVNKFINKWLPAHLAYKLLYEKLLAGSKYLAAIWQDDEILILRQVKL